MTDRTRLQNERLNSMIDDNLFAIQAQVQARNRSGESPLNYSANKQEPANDNSRATTRRRAIVPPKLATDQRNVSESFEKQQLELQQHQQQVPSIRFEQSDELSGPEINNQNETSSPRRKTTGDGDDDMRVERYTDRDSSNRQSSTDQLLVPTTITTTTTPLPDNNNGKQRDSDSRRRSSIAVIPQMQICPGDLLVYSKQLIDRMNQSDETEQPPQFLTIDDKKSKNIWSSFKLFETRTVKARNQYLLSLEDVLTTIQPSTFVDEQLSRFKGMTWDEFLHEIERERCESACDAAFVDNDKLGNTVRKRPSTIAEATGCRFQQPPPPPPRSSSQQLSGVQELNESPPSSPALATIRATDQHSSDSQQQGSTTTVPQAIARAKQTRLTGTGNLNSRPQPMREKPKLKRGQTVDSVFRIPLIPSSPLKHAQQHQQTPTHAHLATIEDEEQQICSPTSQTTKNTDNDIDSRDLSTQMLNFTGGNNSQPFNDGSIQAGFLNQSYDTNRQVTGGNNEMSPTFEVARRQASLSALSTVTKTEQKRQRALWDLFQSECTFFFDHLMTLKNVYMEPLKKIQVEGFAMFADPDVLFGNLDELCCGVYDFCKEFLYIIVRTLETKPDELNATDVLIKLYKKNSKIDHLRAVYHRYTLNYINALTYLDSLRKQFEFVEFERWASRDSRCKKLQLTDLLVAPVQHIMRVPIILKDIESHSENLSDREEIRQILCIEEASVRELDDKMRWLKNFERLLEIQKNIYWPSVCDMEPKLYVPEFVKGILAKQPCEKLIVSPRRQIVHEGTLAGYDSGKSTDMHVILFDDMLLLTRRKHALTKKTSIVCKSSTSTSSSSKDDGSFRYVVYKQPLSLDRFYVYDIDQSDLQNTSMKNCFMLIVLNRFQQVINVHSFGAPSQDLKQTWLFKIKKTSERWKRNYCNPTTTTPVTQSNQNQQVDNECQDPDQSYKMNARKPRGRHSLIELSSGSHEAPN